jgi:hypothetical protein
MQINITIVVAGSIFFFILRQKNLWWFSCNTDKHAWYIQWFLPLKLLLQAIEYIIYTNDEHITCALSLIPTFSEFVIEQLITRGLAFLSWTDIVDPTENIFLHSIISTRYSCATQYWHSSHTVYTAVPWYCKILLILEVGQWPKGI